MYNFILINAITLANKAHSGQFDLAGMPYILHPLYVMHRVETIEEKIVAILHDVTEDTKITLDDIMINISNNYNFKSKIDLYNIRNSLWRLDKNNFKDYESMIEGISSWQITRNVKIADLEHNMDLKRIIGKEDMTEKDMKRFKKYMKSWSYLKNIKGGSKCFCSE